MQKNDLARSRGLALSDSLAKKTAPFPTPKVPFFFLLFLSTSETGHVCMSSALAFVDLTKSSGSAYVLAGGGGYVLN